jgi:hypothetical protein
MADHGTVYIYNMCDQSVKVELNEGEDPKGAIEPIADKPPYTPSSHTAPRIENPHPFAEWALGSGDSSSENTLKWHLGTDRRSTRKVELSLTQRQLHLENDCQIYIFYDAAVLRWDGSSETVIAVIAPATSG